MRFTDLSSIPAKPSGAFRVLATGDCVGKPGRKALVDGIPTLRRELAIDFIAANIENATNGFGLNIKNAHELLGAGANVLTSGDHIRDRREIDPILASEETLLRPANYEDMPGKGVVILECRGLRVGVANMMGKAFLADYGNPLEWAGRCHEMMEGADIKLLDVHAEATAEKVAIGWYLDGKVSAVWGTHTHVQTGDETILPNGTGYITDLGFVGGHLSVLGRQVERVHNHMLGVQKSYMEVSKEWVRIDGCIFDIEPESGRCVQITRLQWADAAWG